MPYTAQGKHAMLAALGATHVQAYNGNPASGGTSVGARVAVSWDAPASGGMIQNGTVNLPVNAGATINHVAYWSAPSGGELRGYDPVDAESFTGAGVYELTETTLSITD